MPKALEAHESLLFLYVCMEHSDWTRTDFARVAARFGIQPPAARMRLARLRDSLDPRRERKRRAGGGRRRDSGLPRKKQTKEGLELGVPKEDDDDDDENIVVAKREDESGVRVKDEDEDEDEMPLLRERFRGMSQQQPLPEFAPGPVQQMYAPQQQMYGGPQQQMFDPRLHLPPGQSMYQVPPHPNFQYGQHFVPLGPPQPPMRAPTPMAASQTPMRVPTPMRTPQTPTTAPARMQQPLYHHEQQQQLELEPRPMFQPPYYGPPSGDQRMFDGGEGEDRTGDAEVM